MKVNLITVALSKLSSIWPWAGGTFRVLYFVKNLCREKKETDLYTINLKVGLVSSHIFF